MTMAASLANTIFQGNSRDAMVVSDAYKISKNETRNSMYDSVKGIYSGAVDGLFANKSSITTLAGLVKQSKGGNVDKISMLNSALGAMGSSLPSLLGTLGGSLKNVLGDAAGSLIGPGAEKSIEVLYKNAGMLIGAADIDSTHDLLKFVNAMAGDSELTQFINIEAESAIIGGIAKNLMDFGLDDLVDEAIEMGRTEQVRQNAFAYMSVAAVNGPLGSGVGGSNLDMINKVIDNIGITKFLEYNPDAVASIIAGYNFDPTYTVADYPAQRTKLLNTLLRINANWDKKLRGAEYIPNLGPFLKQSASSKTLFCMSPPLRTLSLAATGKATANVGTVVKTLYPNAYMPGIK
jgi:hypothetical protein